MTDAGYMRLALEEAWKGCGHVNPNPMVGCVIVKDGEIIGRGFHETYGGLHAERNALRSCIRSPQGATVYVTLEPCCHYGKTPPCTDALIENRVARVVFGSADPNPLVRGKSAGILQAAGIQTEGGVLQNECDKLNEAFFFFITRRRPFIILKYAMTADGKTATATGKSRWITGEKARQRVHFDRHRHAAVLAGVGTVLADNPMLTCRFAKTAGDAYPDTGALSQPVRIVCDTNLRTPLDSALVQSARDVPLILATAVRNPEVAKPYRDKGCGILPLDKTGNGVDLHALSEELGKRNIVSVIVEGGPTIAWSFLQAGLVNKVQVYLAPKIFGGKGKSAVEGSGIDLPSQAFRLSGTEITAYGEDFLLEGEAVPPDARNPD